MPFDAEHLYSLLPSVYRTRDVEQGYPLRDLVSVMADVVAASIEEDLAQLYDDQFIETCADWVVPYIGDLIGHRTLYGVVPQVSSPRAEVANTIGYRRRRGTAAMLEQMARDVTGWDARVVEFFQVLATTQHMQHLRPGNRSILSVREPAKLERIGTPFDAFSHTVDMRRISSGGGRYNIPNVGIFLWRLGAYAFTDLPVPAVDGDILRYRFDPLGTDRPLYSAPLREAEISHLAERVNVPMPITYLEAMQNLPVWWGTSFSVSYGGNEVLAINETVADIRKHVGICNLADDPASAGAWVHIPSSAATDPDTGDKTDPEIAIDPVLGRVAFRDDIAPADVRFRFHSAFSADMGGGEYERAASFDLFEGDPDIPVEVVTRSPATAGTHLSIEDAFTALGDASGVVEVDDPGSFALPALDLAPGQRVEIRAANGRRPILVPDAGGSLRGGGGSHLFLNGFLVTSRSLQVAGALDFLTIRHCTLVPGLALAPDGEPVALGSPSIVLDPDPENLAFTLEISQSITGPLRFPAEDTAASSGTPGLRCTLVARESIIDAGGREPRAERTPALAGAVLGAFPTTLPATLTLRVTIGDDGPHLVTLGAAPADIDAAAAALQAAIQVAASGPAFSGARVVAHENRLVLTGGNGDRLVIEPAGPDPTATLLGLSPTLSTKVSALRSGPLPEPVNLSSGAPVLPVTIGNETRVISGMPTAYPTREALRGSLQAALRASSTTASFANAMVVMHDNRLVVLPGAGDSTPLFGADMSDPGTLDGLGLGTRPAVGAGPDGEQPGLFATFDRSTVVGPVYANEIALASESIFLHQVIVERRQQGCMRFSYVSPGSRTPRRYKCQPATGALSGTIRPTFNSLRFHDPAYCQLSSGCPVEISRGGADEAEMGAFHDLFQPQRETNLRLRIEEYLRLGLEAGVIFAS